ncbi:MAG: UDP-glucose 4-epimerase [Chlamydiae bacterium]|nr:UDP-glucose 4-epimerase [Chlamydiota bacterium]
MKVLVTGGAGYIGSHVCKALKQAGYTPVVFDNLSHGHKWAVQWGPLFRGDILNKEDLDNVILEYQPSAVIHLAGSIHLRESIEKPDLHYENNVIGSLTLFRAMVKHGIRSLVFSSSAAVYAPPEYLPMDELHPKEPLNPYGRTKWIIEQTLGDFHKAYGLNSASLRYFNAAGADPESEIGEAHDPETHLIPRLLFTAQNKQSHFSLYSDSLDTPDGTAVRDFIHVLDLASAHVKALEWLKTHDSSSAFNVGTGKGHSILEVVKKAEEITKKSIPITLAKRDIAEAPTLIADGTKIKEELGWAPLHSSLEEIIQTAWDWHTKGSLVRR